MSTVWPVYRPTIQPGCVYTPHPGAQPRLRYNHDVDIVRFQGRVVAGWNANEQGAEDVPGQFNFLALSNDFQHWTRSVRLFTAAADCVNPVESDNQWQPSFINLDDKTLLCCWCDYNGRRMFVSTSTDGARWANHEVPLAPPELAGEVVGFPTNHGLVTRAGTLVFPCSLPDAEARCIVGHTRYAGLLLSFDGGATWEWSRPIEGVTWSSLGEDPAAHGGERIYLWEPAVYEQADGRLGLLVRNSTSQDNPERLDRPHQMLLHATSDDQGRTWTAARPVEVDTIISRNYAVAGAGHPESLLMVMNDWWCNVPQRISYDRYHLALFVAPVPEPDLLLPGPVIQPGGGTAFYPNGFVEDGRLYLAYTYPPGIYTSLVEPLPDFSRPFLLPRGGRPGLRLESGLATFEQRQSTLGLVLTAAQTRQATLRLTCELKVEQYDGGPWPLITVGGKTRDDLRVRVAWSAEHAADRLQVSSGGAWDDLAPATRGAWQRLELGLDAAGTTVTAAGGPARTWPVRPLRKIAFGGLYERPEWPAGVNRASDVRLKLETLAVE